MSLENRLARRAVPEARRIAREVSGHYGGNYNSKLAYDAPLHMAKGNVA